MKNITARSKKEFKSEDDLEPFLQACKGLIYASTEEDLNATWSKLKQDFAAYPELQHTLIIHGSL